MTSLGSVGDRRRGGLWRQHDYRLFWTGETTSQVGTAVTSVALPLVAVSSLHASTFVVGVLNAATWLPWLVLGPPAGAWIDRLPRRPAMLTCDALSLVAFLSVPVAAWAGVLSCPRPTRRGDHGDAGRCGQLRRVVYVPDRHSQPRAPTGPRPGSADHDLRRKAAEGLRS
ncbi:MAG: MFS transporter [Acidimicrobiales bacterium]